MIKVVLKNLTLVQTILHLLTHPNHTTPGFLLAHPRIKNTTLISLPVIKITMRVIKRTPKN